MTAWLDRLVKRFCEWLEKIDAPSDKCRNWGDHYEHLWWPKKCHLCGQKMLKWARRDYSGGDFDGYWYLACVDEKACWERYRVIADEEESIRAQRSMKRDMLNAQLIEEELALRVQESEKRIRGAI